MTLVPCHLITHQEPFSEETVRDIRDCVVTAPPKMEIRLGLLRSSQVLLLLRGLVVVSFSCGVDVAYLTFGTTNWS